MTKVSVDPETVKIIQQIITPELMDEILKVQEEKANNGDRGAARFLKSKNAQAYLASRSKKKS